MTATHGHPGKRPPLPGSLLYLLLNLPLGIFWFALLVTLISTGVTTMIIWVGIAVSAFAVLLWRAGAQFERGRTAVLLKAPIDHAYRQLPTQGHNQRWKTRLRDSATWRELTYLLLLLPTGIVEFTLVVTFWSVGLAGLGLPIYYRFLPGGQYHFPSTEQPWFTVDSTVDALPWVVLGLLFLVIAVMVTQALAVGHVRLARALLGSSAHRTHHSTSATPAESETSATIDTTNPRASR